MCKWGVWGFVCYEGGWGFWGCEMVVGEGGKNDGVEVGFKGKKNLNVFVSFFIFLLKKMKVVVVKVEVEVGKNVEERKDDEFWVLFLLKIFYI